MTGPTVTTIRAPGRRPTLWGGALLAALLCAGGLCASLAAAAEDYLTPAQRAAVQSLKAQVAAAATTPSTRGERARVFHDWLNAYALTGQGIPVNATLAVVGTLTYNNRPGADAALDAMIREFTLLDEAPDAVGTLRADLGPFPARGFVTLRQTYTVGSRAIQRSGGLLVARHFMPRYGAFQATDPAADNYVSIAASNPGVAFTADQVGYGGMHGGFRGSAPTLFFRLTEGELTPGDTVTITYGDRAGGSRGFEMSRIASDRMPLPLYVDLDGSGHFLTLPIQPIEVVGGPVAGIHGFAPSVVGVNEPFDLHVRVRDRDFNRATGLLPGWQVLLDGKPYSTLPDGEEPMRTVAGIKLAEPGVYRFSIRSDRGQIVGTANPVLVEANPQTRVYWGDTHGHSGYAEGVGTPDRFMRWARDDARLDFVTHSEHDIWLDAFEWRTLAAKVTDYDRPGSFVAYLGYEWTVNNTQGGHHNVLFRSPYEGAASAQPGAPRRIVNAQFFPTLSQLHAGLRAHHPPRDVLVIPHAHQAGDYRLGDPALEPLIEIMSQHGDFEWFGRAYLRQGHRVGFIAASDNHLSQPGYTMPQGGSLSQRGGLAAVLAREHGRDALFNAMRERRTYATSGERMILRFAVNDTSMGGQGVFAERRAITGRVIGTAPIDTVTVFRNDEVLWQRRYADASPASATARDGGYRVTFQSPSRPAQRGDNPRGWRHWVGTLTVRGAQIEAATPVNFENLAASRFATDGNAIRFATLTRGNSSSIDLTLRDVKRGARIDISLEPAREFGGAPQIWRRHAALPASRLSLSVQDLARTGAANAVAKTLPSESWEDSVTLRRLDRDGPLDVRFDIDDSSTNQGDYYFVRATQTNDATAWSSPVWIGGYPPR
ncbi:MAG: DUF3604 domain-containing protein [Pseudomonadota bacterium]